MRLRDLSGQDHATGVLRRAVASRHVPHAYLFEGPDGVGKRSAALGLALALTCAVEPGEGCGTCDSCRRIEAGLHPDVPTFSAETTQIVIEQAQTIVAMAGSRPHEAAARVIVIDDADRLNVNAANCLLKTLEEPSSGTHLVLVTSVPDRILATIRSRVQRIRFRALPAEALVVLLTQAHAVEPRRAAVAAALADGSVTRALRAVGAEDDALWESVSALQAAAGGGADGAAGGGADGGGAKASGAVGRIFDAAAAVAGDKEIKQALPPILSLLGRLYRDALVSAAGAPDLALFREQAAALAAAGMPRLVRALAAVVETDAALAANMNALVAVERLLLELRRNSGAPGWAAR
jgi:DNA polymerase III subunit delta'